MNPGQAEKQGIKKDDYVVQLGGWWIPPLAHPRRAELLDVLRRRFTGTVTKDLEVVPVVFVRVSIEDEVKQEAETPHSTPHAAMVPGPSNLWTPQAEVAKARAEALAEHNLRPLGMVLRWTPAHLASFNCTVHENRQLS